jgi:MFS transporter, NNP family, nitrate/nitrite transporter
MDDQRPGPSHLQALRTHSVMACVVFLLVLQVLLLTVAVEAFLRQRPEGLLPSTVASGLCFAAALFLLRLLGAEASAPRPAAGAPPGHWPTLAAALLHFTVSFMLWVLLGALGIYIAEDLRLSPLQKGLMVATPILSGALLRMPVGWASDRFGGRRVGVAILCFLYLPLTLGVWRADSFVALLGVGLMLGVAGASFAAALPLVSRWFPAKRQGLVVGIAAIGNGGTVLANLTVPALAEGWGWRSVFGLAMVPLSAALVAFLILARDNPHSRSAYDRRTLLPFLKQQDLWWFCFFYSVTFGGYVGLSSFLPLFLHDQHGVDAIAAGGLTAVAALVGAVVRPLGGHLADRWGGIRALSVLLSGTGLLYALCAQEHPLSVTTALVLITMLLLGMGNGAVFQQVPQRFANHVGLATGVVGAVGGLGGFAAPIVLGGLKQSSGEFASGFTLLAGAAFLAVAVLHVLSSRPGWCLCWRGPHVEPGPPTSPEEPDWPASFPGRLARFLP